MRKTFSVLASITILSTAAFISPSSADSKGIPNENAVGYWTDARMKSALPVELVVDPKTKIGVLQTSPASNPTPAPSPSPTDGDWVSNGLPQFAVGKVFFTLNNSNYVCSGSLIDDSNSGIAIVLTAGHCVIDKGKFAKNWMFVPNYDNLITQNSGEIQPADKWYATNLVVRSEFANSRQFNTTAIQHDWAFAVLKKSAFSKDGFARSAHDNDLPDTRDTSSNALALHVSGFPNSSTSWAFGYPAAQPYNGKELKYAYGLVTGDPATGNTTWGMPSPLTGGASGGPWLSFLASDYSSGKVSSLNSYKYTNDLTRMYGPKFASKTTATFEAAKTNSCITNLTTTCTANLIVSLSSVTQVSSK